MRSWGWWGRRWWCFPKGCWTQYLYPGPSGITFLIFVLFCLSYQSHLMSFMTLSNTFKIWSFHLFSACVLLWVKRRKSSQSAPRAVVKLFTVPKTGPARRENPCQSLRNRYPWHRWKSGKQRQETWEDRGVKERMHSSPQTDFWPLWIIG